MVTSVPTIMMARVTIQSCVTSGGLEYHMGDLTSEITGEIGVLTAATETSESHAGST